MTLNTSCQEENLSNTSGKDKYLEKGVKKVSCLSQSQMWLNIPVAEAILLMCTLSHNWENLVVTLNTSCLEENLSNTSGKDKYLERGVKKVSCLCESQMWLNIPAEKGTDKEVHRGGTNLMQDPSPKVNLLLLWKTWKFPEVQYEDEGIRPGNLPY